MSSLAAKRNGFNKARIGVRDNDRFADWPHRQIAIGAWRQQHHQLLRHLGGSFAERSLFNS
jgi:hypothetical protein